MKGYFLLLMAALIMIPLSLAEIADTSAPLVNAINVVEITKTSAKITWTSDEPANSEVLYDLGRLSSAELVKKHAVVLEGLKPASMYHFNITSCDAAKNCASASGNSLSFATLGYVPFDPTLQKSNFTKALLNSVSKFEFLNFSEQNPIKINLDAKEGLYFIYKGSEYALMFPKQTDVNTSVRMMPFNREDVMDYGAEMKFDLDNDSVGDIHFKLGSARRTEYLNPESGIKYVDYTFNITIQDLNKSKSQITSEDRVKFEVNPVHEPQYEPPVKEGDIGVSTSVIEQRKASILMGLIIAFIVFVAGMFTILLAKGGQQ